MKLETGFSGIARSAIRTVKAQDDAILTLEKEIRHLEQQLEQQLEWGLAVAHATLLNDKHDNELEQDWEEVQGQENESCDKD